MMPRVGASMTLSTGASVRIGRGRHSGAWACAALLVLMLLSACSALPRVVPDMKGHVEPPRIEGAHGPLSAARSKQVLDALRASGRPSDVLDRHLALERVISDSPLVADNQVSLLQDGPTTYAAMFAAIESARDNVNMETYIQDDDEVGKRFSALLLDKQQHGVQVNLIHDGVGTLSTPQAFFDQLIAAGVNVLEFNPINPLNAQVGWDVTQRDHRKLLIVDGKTALLGGINISSVYSSGSLTRIRKRAENTEKMPWRHTDLQIDGPVVAEFQKLFIDTWNRQKGAPLAERNYFPAPPRQGNEVVHAVGSSPDEPYSLIYAGRHYYDELLESGIQFYERKDAILHAKTALVDVWATVGSTNLDWRSFLHNQEVNAVVLGASFGKRMRVSFDADLAASEQLTLEAWRQRSIGQRLKENFGRLWQYWM